MKCIVCEKPFEQLHEIEGDLSDMMWENGNVSKYEGGYGSQYDNETFYIGLCDSCTKEKIEKGVIKI